MIELLITSSLLILAVLAARALLAGRISRRMQYALWGLVLLRLLLPVSLPQSRASVLNALPDTAQVSLTRPEEFSGETLPAPVDTKVQTGTAPETDLAQPATGGTQAGISGGVADTSGSEPHPEWSLNPAALLPLVWAAGAVLTGGALLWANLRFALRLRRERCQLDLAPELTGNLPVYLCHELASPCLHGLLHPAIYLNPAALENRERLDFVLAHEKTHYRHKDHIWGALRCVLLAMYWFDPLVWWASAASRRDCELACDEAVTAAMEEARRRDYGRCLVELIPNRARGTALLAATSMSANATAFYTRLVLHVREKATGQESYLRLPDPPADRQPAKTDGEPVDSRKYSYEEMVVEPQASVEFTKRLDELADGIQYEGGDAPLTVTIPETAEPGEWELHLVRYNESRGSWSSLSAGLPDAFVSQGWQPGQQETVNRTVMSQQGSYRLEVRNTLLNASAQILLPPASASATDAEADAADAAERQYEDWVASQSTYRPTPTPMPIDSLGGEGYPEGRVRSRGTLELDGRTQEMVALQIQPPEGVTLAGDELYLNLYYRDSQAPNPEFSLAFTGPVSVYQTFTIDYRDAESRTLTGTSPEGAASMELKIRLHSEPNQSSASDWRHYRVDEAGITVS